MHLRRSRFTSIFVLPHDRVLLYFAQSPVEGNAMQKTNRTAAGVDHLSRFPFGPFNQLRRAHMQQKIVFKSKGLNCSGLFDLPDNYSATGGKQLPAIAMAHGMGIP